MVNFIDLTKVEDLKNQVKELISEIKKDGLTDASKQKIKYVLGNEEQYIKLRESIEGKSEHEMQNEEILLKRVLREITLINPIEQQLREALKKLDQYLSESIKDQRRKVTTLLEGQIQTLVDTYFQQIVIVDAGLNTVLKCLRRGFNFFKKRATFTDIEKVRELKKRVFFLTGKVKNEGLTEENKTSLLKLAKSEEDYLNFKLSIEAKTKKDMEKEEKAIRKFVLKLFELHKLEEVLNNNILALYNSIDSINEANKVLSRLRKEILAKLEEFEDCSKKINRSLKSATKNLKVLDKHLRVWDSD